VCVCVCVCMHPGSQRPSSLMVTDPSSNRDRRALTSVSELTTELTIVSTVTATPFS